jgi:hypothetical protein
LLILVPVQLAWCHYSSYTTDEFKLVYMLYNARHLSFLRSLAKEAPGIYLVDVSPRHATRVVTQSGKKHLRNPGLCSKVCLSTSNIITSKLEKTCRAKISRLLHARGKKRKKELQEHARFIIIVLLNVKDKRTLYD